MRKYLRHYLICSSRALRDSLRLARRLISRVAWLLRWKVRRLLKSAPGETVAFRFEDVRCYFINLNRRTDRRRETESALQGVGVATYSRFDAVDGSALSVSFMSSVQSGSLGCALSHKAVLGNLLDSETPVLICEDDVHFAVGAGDFRMVVQEFLDNPYLDVLCLAANVSDLPVMVSNRLAISQDISTTACYLVKPLAIPLLHKCFDESSRRLLAGEAVQTASIDQLWKELQRRSLFFGVPTQKIALQRRSKSDITGNIEDRGV